MPKKHLMNLFKDLKSKTLAKFYNEVGDFENAILILKELENQVKIKFGEHSAFYMQILGNISSILANTRNFKEAINLKRKAFNFEPKHLVNFILLLLEIGKT